MYINNGYAKSLLRDVVKGILCDEVRLDRKVGFNSSINSLVKLKSKETINFIHNHKETSNYVNCNKFIEFLKSKKDR